MRPTARRDQNVISCSVRTRRQGAGRVSDGTRTRDFLDHNQVLYQLSYTHHANGPNKFVDRTAQREVYRAVVGGRNQLWLGTVPVSAP